MASGRPSRAEHSASILAPEEEQKLTDVEPGWKIFFLLHSTYLEKLRKYEEKKQKIALNNRKVIMIYQILKLQILLVKSSLPNFAINRTICIGQKKSFHREIQHMSADIIFSEHDFE